MFFVTGEVKRRKKRKQSGKETLPAVPLFVECVKD